mmetsp:Transcript_9201/g.41794  ORF Transcript_9201/g.41794 Transcript_9201/m.41794 type:complete len:240 (-) Transcript_9201:694-1413(-)
MMSTSHGAVGAVVATPSRCCVVVMTTPARSAAIASTVGAGLTSTSYVFGALRDGSSNAAGTRPSSVRTTRPSLSRSSRPTGKTLALPVLALCLVLRWPAVRASGIAPRTLSSSFRAYIMLDRCDASIVQVTPLGLLYLRYTNPFSPREHDCAPMALSVAAANGSQSKTTPSRVTTSPERTLNEGLTSAPLTRTRPALTASSASRRFNRGMHRTSRNPSPAYLRSGDRIPCVTSTSRSDS